MERTINTNSRSAVLCPCVSSTFPRVCVFAQPPTTPTWRKRLGLPVEVPNNWRPAACPRREVPTRATQPRSHPTFSACFSGLLPCPRLGRRLAHWRLDGAPLPARTARRTAHAHRAEVQRQRAESGRPSPLLPPHLHSRAAEQHPRARASPLRANLCPSSVFASTFQPSAPDLFFFPPNHAGFQQSHRVSPRAKRKPQHPKPPSPAAACPRQWHHDGHAWRKPI